MSVIVCYCLTLVDAIKIFLTKHADMMMFFAAWVMSPVHSVIQ